MKRFNKLLFMTTSAILAGCTQPHTSQLTSGIHTENMDTTFSPRQDFYHYACGEWIKNNPLKPEYSRYGVFEMLGETNKKQLIDLITGISEQTHEQGSLGQKISDLYKMAMDSAQLNQQEALPIKDDLHKIAALSDKSELPELIGWLHTLGIAVFWNTYVSADDMNSTQNILHIAQGGLFMDDKSYYLSDDEKNKHLRDAYLQLIENSFQLSGYDLATARQKAQSVMKIETSIAKASLSRVELRDPYLSYHKVSLQDLSTNSSAIQWNKYLSAIGLSDVTTLNLAHPKALASVSDILEKEELPVLVDYMQWALIHSASPFLSDKFVQTSFEFYGKEMSGQEKMQERWKRTLNVINSVLGEAVGKMYVEKYFPAEAKERMLQMVSNLQKSLGERISNVTWMGETTKAKALEKLNTFHVKIGYPDKWRDYSLLTIQHDSYWDNIKRSQLFNHQYNISQWNKPVDRDEWLMTPQTINAYYNPATNEICFPAAILQPPFFDMKADDAANYGAIGVVIGHEMTHGFDDQGRQYDKNGNLEEWWDKQDAEQFKQRAAVLENYFNNITVLDTLKANGALTLGENIADYGGITVAFNAFSHLIDQNKAHIAKSDFTPQQRFFIAYATLWANTIRNEEIIRRTNTDPHSLGQWRVNGILPHIEAFYEAFNVKEGDAMYIENEKRVKIW